LHCFSRVQEKRGGKKKTARSKKDVAANMEGVREPLECEFAASLRRYYPDQVPRVRFSLIRIFLSV
jgi:hypothetical protein